MACLRIAVLLSFGLLAACTSASGPCGSCPSGTACNTVTRSCVAALSPGEACNARLPDGGSDGTPCAQGSVCAGIPSEGSVCAVTCDPFTPDSCPGTELCAELPAPDGGTQGVCITGVAPGQACDPATLEECTSPAVCIQPPGQTAGTCFTICDPSQTGGCTSPQECLAVLSTADAGICATPVSADAGCNVYANLYCPPGVQCIQSANTDAGACFVLCDPSEPANPACPSGESCLSPLGPSGESFCAVPQQEGDACGTTLDLFCSNSELCVTGTAGSPTGVCKVNCSDGGMCPPNETCNPTTNPDINYCD